MKELYMTPEAKFACFAPMQNVANDAFDIDADKLFGGTPGVSAKPGDIDMPAIQG